MFQILPMDFEQVKADYTFKHEESPKSKYNNITIKYEKYYRLYLIGNGSFIHEFRKQ